MRGGKPQKRLKSDCSRHCSGRYTQHASSAAVIGSPGLDGVLIVRRIDLPSAVRDESPCDKPSLDDLVASGDYEGPFRQGDVTAFLSAIASSKRERERRALSLADVSEHSGLDKRRLSRLENSKLMNPTLTTLAHAEAVGMHVGLAVKAVPAATSKATYK